MHVKLIDWVVAASADVAVLIGYPTGQPPRRKAKNDSVVKDGMLVSIDYTLKGTDGKVIDTNKGREPLKYVQGKRR